MHYTLRPCSQHREAPRRVAAARPAVVSGGNESLRSRQAPRPLWAGAAKRSAKPRAASLGSDHVDVDWPGSVGGDSSIENLLASPLVEGRCGSDAWSLDGSVGQDARMGGMHGTLLAARLPMSSRVARSALQQLAPQSADGRLAPSSHCARVLMPLGLSPLCDSAATVGSISSDSIPMKGLSKFCSDSSRLDPSVDSFDPMM